MSHHLMQRSSEWLPAADAWKRFAQQHPELGYSPGRMAFYNFLRYYRDPLIEADALRRAKRRFWIAHESRFAEAAFDCATGQAPRRASGLQGQPLDEAARAIEETSGTR